MADPTPAAAKPKSGKKASPPPPELTREELKRALSSERFARTIHLLHHTDNKELLYLKLQDYLRRTTAGLGMDVKNLQLGYAAKAKDAVGRINKPVVGSVLQGIAEEEVREYSSSLGTLPRVRKDQDYRTAVNAILRISKANHVFAEQFPGLEDDWQQLFEENLNPTIQGLPDLLAADPERQQLFQALASVVSGDVPPELEHVREPLEETHEAFRDGNIERVSDGLFGITSLLTTPPPPKPPGSGPPDPDEDEEEEDESDDSPDEGSSKSDGGGEGSTSGSSGSSSSDDAGSGDEDESEEDASEDESEEEESDPDEQESEEDASEEEDESEEEAEQDPFEALGKFVRSEDDSDYDPQQMAVESQFEPPPDPDDVDMEALNQLTETKADLSTPQVIDGPSYLYYETRTPPDARHAFETTLRLYRSENRAVRNIVDEHYRIDHQVERGLRSGRADGSRLHRVLTAHSQEVFRRDTMDSVGHLDLIVLVDESGSMSAQDRVDGFRDLPPGVTFGSSDDSKLIDGHASATLGRRRADTARLMAMFLLDASRHLPGFNVEVAGYVGGYYGNDAALHKLSEAISKANRGGSHDSQPDRPVVRLLGTQKNPYPITTVGAFGNNADAQGLAYALDRLATSTASQKAVLYLADGHVFDGKKYMERLFKRLERIGAYPFFMNLSPRLYESGPLARMDRQDVRSFKDMLNGLKVFLHNLVNQLG